MKNVEAAGRQGCMTLRGYEPSLSFSISGYVHQSIFLGHTGFNLATHLPLPQLVSTPMKRQETLEK